MFKECGDGLWKSFSSVSIIFCLAGRCQSSSGYRGAWEQKWLGSSSHSATGPRDRLMQKWITSLWVTSSLWACLFKYVRVRQCQLRSLGGPTIPPPDVLHSSCTVRAGASSWIAAVFPPRARPLGDSWETKCCGNCSHSYIELCRYVLCEWEGRQSQRPWEVKWQARVERKIEEECHTCVCVLASPQWTLCVSPLHTLHFIIHNIRWSLQSRGSTWFTTKVYTVKTGAPKLFSPRGPKRKLTAGLRAKSKYMEERLRQLKK